MSLRQSILAAYKAKTLGPSHAKGGAVFSQTCDVGNSITYYIIFCYLLHLGHPFCSTFMPLTTHFLSLETARSFVLI